jgi:hypothetical protein
MTNQPAGNESSKWWVKLGRWIEDRGDTAAALAVGIAAAIAAFLGHIKDVDKLAEAMLTVLVIIAVSMVIERERRLKDRRRLAKILDEIQRTGDAVEVLASPTPYHVLINESIWEIAGNGDVRAIRRKRLRFTQDDVVTVTDWYRGDGSLGETKFFVGEGPDSIDIESTAIGHMHPAKVVHEFPSQGRDCALVALDRAYMRDEVRDYVVSRKGTGIFPKNPDRIWIATLESTSLLRIVLRWSERLPTEVRLIRQVDSAPGRPIKFVPTTSDGRSEFKTEIPEPRQGERIAVEWDWPHDEPENDVPEDEHSATVVAPSEQAEAPNDSNVTNDNLGTQT